MAKAKGKADAKVAKKVAKEPELPKPPEIRKARKAELQAMCRDLDLDDEGTVPVLRERLLEHVEAAEEVKIVEAEEAESPTKIKPVLDDAARRLLRLRDEASRARPEARRQEWFRYRRLDTGWRRPKGIQSKMRRGFAYRTGKPNVGRRGPRGARALHPSGFREVLVHRVEDLSVIDPAQEAARIAHSVGFRKRMEIQDEAAKKGIRVLNPG